MVKNIVIIALCPSSFYLKKSVELNKSQEKEEENKNER